MQPADSILFSQEFATSPYVKEANPVHNYGPYA